MLAKSARTNPAAVTISGLFIERDRIKLSRASLAYNRRPAGSAGGQQKFDSSWSMLRIIRVCSLSNVSAPGFVTDSV
jgi:hypothetical protein